MKQNIMDIEERLTLLPINEVEAVSRFASEYAEYDVFLKMEAKNYELPRQRFNIPERQM